MRATLHLVSAGLLGLCASGGFVLATTNHMAGKPVDFEIVFSCLFALTALANLIYAFKE